MSSMETLTEAAQRLRHAGFVADLRATAEGDLLCRSCGAIHASELSEVRETVRFEGDSNPDDEAILLALSCPNGCLGQFSAAFGPGTSSSDALVMGRLAPTRSNGVSPS